MVVGIKKKNTKHLMLDRFQSVKRKTKQFFSTKLAFYTISGNREHLNSDIEYEQD